MVVHDVFYDRMNWDYHQGLNRALNSAV